MKKIFYEREITKSIWVVYSLLGPIDFIYGGGIIGGTADNERMGELVLVTPHNLNTDLTECGCPEVQ